MLSVRGTDIAGLRCPTERAALRNVIYCVVSQSGISWASCWEALGVHFPQLKMRTYRLSLDVTGEKDSIVVSGRFHCTPTDTYFLKPQQQLKRRGEAHRLKRQVEVAAAVQHQWQAGAPSRSNIWNRAHNVLSLSPVMTIAQELSNKNPCFFLSSFCILSRYVFPVVQMFTIRLALSLTVRVL